MKGSKKDAAVTLEKFIYANVLIGLALIHDLKRSGRGEPDKEDNGEISLKEAVKRTTQALAPFLVPMIDYLGALTPEEALALGQKGDDD